MFRKVSALLLVLPICALAQCKSKRDVAGSAPGASISAAVAASAPIVKPSPPYPTVFPIPVGPRMAVYPGAGVGPIRIGATVSTIERHMQAPCEVLDKDKCRYVTRAVDFELTDGVVSTVLVQRRDRPAGTDAKGKPRVYGIFNGAIPPDLQPGMYAWAIQEHLGKPKRVEKVAQKNPNNTEELHFYDGMVLEYDRLPNGNVVLGGIRIKKGI